MAVNCGSAAFAEAGSEALGEAGHEDVALGGSDVVGHAVEGDLGGVGVVEGEGGSPIAIAGLSDGAGIDEMTPAGFELECPGLGGGTGAKGGAKLFPLRGRGLTVEGEAALDVGVADEGDRGGALLERRPRVAHAEDVVVFVERGAVSEGDGGKEGGGVEVGLGGVGCFVVGGGGGPGGDEDLFRDRRLVRVRVERALRKVAEPGEVGFGELGFGPLDGGASRGIEVDGGGEAAADAVVIAADGDGGERADEVDDLIGAAAVTDGVAEIPQGVEAGGRGVEGGGESFEVAVNVGEDEGAHGGRARSLQTRITRWATVRFVAANS